MRKHGLAFLLLFTISASLPAQPVVQASRVVPADAGMLKPRDASKLPESAQPIFYSAARALDWLKLANKPDGRFVYGFQPSLRVQIDGDNFVSQAGATMALARASRYFRDERGSAIARQAALALLMETTLESGKPIRYTDAPPSVVNRLAAHGLLISAIHEMQTPGNDLLEKADQLCNYLREQQRADGSLLVLQGTTDVKSGSAEFDAVPAGLALQGIVRSHKLRPAEWKLDSAKKACAYYHAQWQASKSTAIVANHVPAYAEAYLLTKEEAFAESVLVMSDWLVSLQYRNDVDADRKHWIGGFPRVRNGKTETAAPDIWSAQLAVCLAEACRVAKHKGDLPRLQRYERALVMNCHFAMSLQYTPAKTQHFVEPFRPMILGGFHASHQDGNLRIDYTQHPLCAMTQYLDTVVE
jgi:hypothetical protein